MITDEIIESGVECKYKAYLKFNCAIGNKTEFEYFYSEVLESNKVKFFRNIRERLNKDQILSHFDFRKKIHPKTDCLVISPTFSSEKYNIKLDALEISIDKSSQRKYLYTPLLISPHEAVSKKEKLILCIKCLLVFKPIKIALGFGQIIYGEGLKTTKFNLEAYLKEAKKLLVEIDDFINGRQSPSIHRNNHCNICEFQQSCRKILIEKNDLSLLGRISQKEISKQNNKGIFTIQQLSYTFKPRKRKRTSENQRFLWELKALALREKQTYILEIPKIPESIIEIFLDIEGLPNESFNYLIGLIIREEKTERYLSFWAKSKEDEENIFKLLFTELLKYKDYVIYYYGSYEPRALQRMSKLLENYDINLIMSRSINILALFHSNVYPPSYGNGLKEIASLLNFEWSESSASGIQSIVWRKKWELSGCDEYKIKLLQYNFEDCAALKLIKDPYVSSSPETPPIAK